MAEEKDIIQQVETEENLQAFIFSQMKEGASKSTIIKNLIKMGIDENKAPTLCERIHGQIMETVKKEQFTSTNLVTAAVGGVLAAAVCGVLWGLIVITTEYEIGYMAWAVGFAAGFAVLLFSGGKRGIPLQVIAVASSVLGIIIGKYLTFFYYLREMIEQEHGQEAASNLSVLSTDVMQFFFANIISMSHPMDLLWIIFAVATAWRIPKGSGIQLQSETSALNPDENQ